jgi:hypothetical protein
VPMPVVEVRSTPAGTTETGTAPLPHTGPPAVRVQSGALRTVPGLAEPDVLRSLQTLPSVAAMSDFSSALYVRGGAADQSMINLDGIPLFNPYHVGGIFSAIPVDAVSTVDLWPGAMPARAGDRLSGTVNVHTRDGARNGTRASGGIGLISSHVTVDGPLGSGSWLLSGRRTYLDAMTRAAYALNVIDVTIPYSFTDVYSKATLPVGQLGAISLSGYLDREGIRFPSRMRDEMGANANFGWGSGMVALNYRQPLGASVLLQARAGYTEFRGSFDAWELDDMICTPSGCVETPSLDSTHVVSAHTRAADAIAAADLTWFSGRHTLRLGAQLDAYRFDHGLDVLEDVDEHLFPLFTERRSPRTLAFHIEDEWDASSLLSARLGVRMLHAGNLGTVVLPRFGLSLQLTPVLSVTAGGGAYAQVLRSMRNDESVASSFIAYDIITAQPASVGLARGTDAVAGVALASVNTALRADVYMKRSRNLVLAARSLDPMNAPTLVVDSFRVGRGRAEGVELSAQHRHGSAELGVSWAFSRTELDAGNERYAARFERRHLVDANAVLPWGTRGLLSLRATYGSGQPFTPVTGIRERSEFDPVTGAWLPGDREFVLGETNSARLPGYFRIDAAARRNYEKRWFGRRTTVTPYLQVLNVLNTRNVLVAEPDPWQQQLRYLPQLPFLPTFGLEWRH